MVEARERAVMGVPTLEGRSDSCTTVHLPAQQSRSEWGELPRQIGKRVSEAAPMRFGVAQRLRVPASGPLCQTLSKQQNDNRGQPCLRITLSLNRTRLGGSAILLPCSEPCLPPNQVKRRVTRWLCLLPFRSALEATLVLIVLRKAPVSAPQVDCSIS